MIVDNSVLDKFVKEEKIRGKGTVENPFVLDSDFIASKEYLFSNLKKNIVIQNNELRKLNLSYCQNILIKNCKIQKLVLENASGNKFISNEIFKLSLRFSGGNYFKKNLLTEKGLKYLKYKNKRPHINKNIQILHIILFLLFYFWFSLLYPLEDFWYFLLVVFGTFCIASNLFYILVSRKIPSNVLEKNKIL